MVTDRLPPLPLFSIRRRPRVRVAAPGRVREPRLVLPAGDPDGDPPRLCAAHGVEGALDGHRLRLPVADHAHVRHHVLHRLEQDGTLFISPIDQHGRGCTRITIIAACKDEQIIESPSKTRVECYLSHWCVALLVLAG
jgi:hypothetical protein